jgi:site-specific recombinase XerD
MYYKLTSQRHTHPHSLKIMVHPSIDVTQIYEHLDQKDLKNTIKGIG